MQLCAPIILIITTCQFCLAKFLFFPNPSLICRLFQTDLEYIINHAEDYLIMLDPVFVDLVVQLQSKLPTVQGFIILTDRQHMPQHSKLKNMHCYEDLLQASCQ